jgi:HAD superfamily hydrolase (TIGR01484 family)
MTLPIQLISTDFDGTLHADFENPPVPLDLQQLIGDLQRQGAKWVINTGRDLSSVMEGIARARLSIKPDYLVVVEREIYLHQESCYIGCEEWNLSCKMAHQELFSRIRNDVPRIIEWIHARFTATLYEDEYSPFCMIADSNDDADAIQAHLEAYTTQIPSLSVVRNDVYARFSHVGFNKGTALGEIARRLEISRDNVFAAGDHLNDVPMLSSVFAKFLAAPQNAIPSVKELVRKQNGYVSHQPWGHGVARGLEFFLNGTASATPPPSGG